MGSGVGEWGSLTLKFDRATWPFPKIDMRGTHHQEKIYYRHDMDLSISSTGDIRLWKLQK